MRSLVLAGAAAVAPPHDLVPGALGLVALALLAGALLRRAEPAMRHVLTLLTRAIYRPRVRGLEHLPRAGGALLVCNHLAYVDPFLVGAAAPRRVRFLMERAFFERPLVGRFGRLMGAIPVASDDAPREQLRALREAAERAAAGELVCIFAEGRISRSGALLPFARGLETIARRAEVPIVPVAIDGVWGSVASFARGGAFRRLPRRVPRPVHVAFGAPLPSDAPAWQVRDAVQRLVADARRDLHGPRDTLSERFLRSAARNARRTAVVESGGSRLTYRRLLLSALVVRKALARRTEPGERVGIYLPPGAGAVVANLATTLAGRVPVNLNYALGPASLADPIERAGLRSIVSSPRFLKALGGEPPSESATIVELERLAGEATRADRLRALALSWLPGPLLARLVRPVRDPAETATVLFSSGSTGRPKGVVLSHANVLSNLTAMAQAFDLERDDRMLGILPFFHCFGYTATLWAPLLYGATVVYHAKPTDAQTIGELCAAEGVTIAISTPTFYQAWMRRIPRESFASLRLAVVGAEKLRASLADAFRERYGLELLEGYGCTELSPVVSVNLPDRPGARGPHVASRLGSVGRPLAGIAVRVVDPETREPLPPEREGRVLVAGPNVMQGYLDDPERTAEVLREGWYDTGDVGRIDADGFLVLTDRAARFSKIGGEMVPHGRVEEELSAAARRLRSERGAEPDSGEEPGLVVTGVPDESKGERLVVLHEPLGFPPELLVEALRASDLPNLFRPRKDQLFEVDEIPRLGTGKTDLAAVRRLALEKAGAEGDERTRDRVADVEPGRGPDA